MAVQVVKMFDPIMLVSSGLTTLYTVPIAPSSMVLGRARVRFTNVTAYQQVVSAYDVPHGQAAGTGNLNLSMVPVAANGYLDVDMPVLGPGGSIVALAGADNSVVVHSMDGVLFS